MSVWLFITETDYMRVKPSLIAAASIAAAANRLGYSNSTDSETTTILAALVDAQVDQLSTLILSIESLMAAQLASVQQQQQQEQHLHLQQQQQNTPVPQQVKNNKLQPTSSWELDVQPETPTDIQDIHFWRKKKTTYPTSKKKKLISANGIYVCFLLCFFLVHLSFYQRR